MKDPRTGEDCSRDRVFGRYGPTAADAAPVAWRLAYLVAKNVGEEITREDLDYAMFLVVNEYDDVAYVAYVVRTYGQFDYGRPLS